MTRVLAGLFAVAALILGPATAAVAAPARAPVVQIVAAQVRLQADGTVSVPLRVRCSPPLDAFELDVSVAQGTTLGSLSRVGGPFPACTGRWERITLSVAAQTGTFRAGPATVSVFIGIFDPVAGGDISAEDSAGVTL